MIRYLSTFSLVLLFSYLFMPMIGMASNDVTLTKGQAQLSVNGATIDIVASDATINSIIVNSTNFQVEMSGTSTMKVQAPGLQKLTVTSSTMASVCNSGESSLNIGNPSSSASTVTVEVSTTLCGTTTNSSGAVSTGGGTVTGLIGKINNEIIGRPQVIYPDGRVVYLDKPEQKLSQEEEESASVIHEVPVAPGVPPVYLGIGISTVFAKTLRKGERNSDVKRLQQLFNLMTDTRISETGAGSQGFETDYYGALTEGAVQRFQTIYGIVTTGSPSITGFGVFGPKTRAKLQEVYSRGTPLSEIDILERQILTVEKEQFIRGLDIGSTGNDVKTLQRALNSDPDTRLSLAGVGSLNQETEYFGSLTRSAVAKFQLKYDLVSKEADIGYGYVGPKTRDKLNELFPSPDFLPNVPNDPPSPVSIDLEQVGEQSVRDTYSWNNLGAVSISVEDSLTQNSAIDAIEHQIKSLLNEVNILQDKLVDRLNTVH